MAIREEDSDSEAPEEFTAQQAIQQDEEITKVQRENKARVIREGKERRRQWAQKLTPRPSKPDKSMKNETEMPQESEDNQGMLPDDIVKLLAAQEKKVFSSDSEEEQTEKPRKKKPKSSRLEPVILKEIPPPQCLQKSLDFLKKRKMQVARSSAVLNNSSQALRYISTSGLLGKN